MADDLPLLALVVDVEVAGAERWGKTLAGFSPCPIGYAGTGSAFGIMVSSPEEVPPGRHAARPVGLPGGRR
jgi:hypothetical protein